MERKGRLPPDSPAPRTGLCTIDRPCSLIHAVPIASVEDAMAMDSAAEHGRRWERVGHLKGMGHEMVVG